MSNCFQGHIIFIFKKICSRSKNSISRNISFFVFFPQKKRNGSTAINHTKSSEEDDSGFFYFLDMSLLLLRDHMRNAGNDNHSSSFSSSSSKLRQLQIGKHDNLNGIERSQKTKTVFFCHQAWLLSFCGKSRKKFDLCYCRQKSDLNFSPIVVVKAWKNRPSPRRTAVVSRRHSIWPSPTVEG